jgi:hypothetical protein
LKETINDADLDDADTLSTVSIDSDDHYAYEVILAIYLTSRYHFQKIAQLKGDV